MGNFEIRDYIRPLQHWWWLLAAAMFIAMLSSFIYTSIQPAVYQSQATIMVGTNIQDLNPNGNEFYLAQQLAETYADIAMRAPIREAARAKLGLDAMPYYTVVRLPNTQMLQLYVYDQDAQRAFEATRELVNQIIAQGPAEKEEQTRRAFVEQQLVKLEKGITDTEDEVVKRENDLLNINSARELANKQNEIAALQTKLTTMRSNYTSLLATTQRGAVNALRILEPPSLPTEPISSNLIMNIMVAAAIGFSLAAGGAYLLEYLDDTIKSSEEVKRLWPITLLGTVPEIAESETGSSRRLVMLQTAPSPAVEAYRALRTNLQFASVDRPLRQILITSAQPEEGKSLTAANLSASLARAGKKVILVDADLHRPTQHRLFKLFNNVGVTTALLSEDIDYESLLQQTSLPDLSVLTSGPLPPNPAELLGSKRMQEVLNALTEYADIVVIDSPPVTAVVDAMILSTQLDGVLMVMRAEKSSRDAIKRALSALQQVNAHLLGAVLNGVSEHRQEYYLHNYGYYSSVYGRALTTTAAPSAPANSEVPAFPMPAVVANGPQGEPPAPQGMPFPIPQQPPMPQPEPKLPSMPPVVAYPMAPLDAEHEHQADYADADITLPHSQAIPRRSTNILRRRTALPWK